MRILFFLGSLKTGGAQRQMAQLANGLAKRGHQVVFTTVFSGGQTYEWLRDLGEVEIAPLFSEKPNSALRTGFQLAISVKRLHRVLISRKIDLIYSSLYLSNLIAWLAAFSLPKIKRVWGIRASDLDLNWKQQITFQLCKWISPSMHLLIANSQAGLDYHMEKGYQAHKNIVLPNGIDTEQFKPNPNARDDLGKAWGLDPGEALIGIIGRLIPAKDHTTFIKAAALLASERFPVRFVIVGDGEKTYRSQLFELCQELGIKNKVIWTGEIADVASAYNALDIVVSSSQTEGFSNVIGEAMACGTPCVVTDVGDSAKIVGDTGKVAPPKDPQALADAIDELLGELEEIDHSRIRTRIVEQFSLEALIENTKQALVSLL